MNDDWVDLTVNFEPLEELKAILEPLRSYQVIVADGDGLYVFLDERKHIRHAVYWLATKWICPCSDEQPCAAVVVLEVTSFNWNVNPSHKPDAWQPRRPS